MTLKTFIHRVHTHSHICQAIHCPFSFICTQNRDLLIASLYKHIHVHKALDCCSSCTRACVGSYMRSKCKRYLCSQKAAFLSLFSCPLPDFAIDLHFACIACDTKSTARKAKSGSLSLGPVPSFRAEWANSCQ